MKLKHSLYGLMATLLAAPALAAPITVYKSLSCSCCEDWMSHMQASGFEVDVINGDNLTPIKKLAGVSAELASCHTGIIDGYVIEGHVPASDVRQLLKQQPEVRGLTIPGMPQSAPGMDIPGSPYQVLSFVTQGNTAVVNRYPG